MEDLSSADSHSRKRAVFLANMTQRGVFAEALFLSETPGGPR
jgi:hypothetical protein